jgi:hypothetical protein
MGSSWSTSLLVTNLSLIPELCTIRFYKDDGSPWRIGAAGSGDSIAAPLVPGETRVFDLSQAGNLEQGWAVLIPGTPSATRISGFAVFQLRISATLSSEAVVGMTNVTDRQFVVLYDNTSGFDTGVALANPNPLTALTITATVRNDTGRVLSTDTLSLPALGHTSFSMPQKFPASANQRGSLLISSSPSGIVGLGLRFNSFLTFTSFPALTSPDIQR